MPDMNTAPARSRRIAFIGSECYPFVKTGGLGDVMYALPRALISQNCEVRAWKTFYIAAFPKSTRRTWCIAAPS